MLPKIEDRQRRKKKQAKDKERASYFARRESNETTSPRW
jgi:hypothetical protein